MNLVPSTIEKTNRSVETSVEYFNEVHRLYAGMVYNYAIKYTRSKQDAEDITQEVFIKLWNGWSRISQIENIKGYLFLITRNQCHSYYRLEIKNRSFLAGYSSVLSEHYHHDGLLEKECNNLYRSAIDKLPEKQQQVFLLRHWDFTRREIAAKLNVSENTVNNNLSIALNKTRRYVCLKLNVRPIDESELFKPMTRVA